MKKERKLPAVALDLLRLSLREGKFSRFWKEVVEQGLLKKQFWPARCVGRWCPAPLPGVLVGRARAPDPTLRGRGSDQAVPRAPQLPVLPPAGHGAAAAVQGAAAAGDAGGPGPALWGAHGHC